MHTNHPNMGKCLVSTSALPTCLGKLWTLTLATVLIGSGCSSASSGPKLSIVAEPNTIPAGGDYSAEIAVRATEGGKAIPGAEIEIVTETGSFLAEQQLRTISVATGADGRSSVQLYSALDEGQTIVTATYAGGNGKEISAQTMVVFGPVQAGDLPVADSFDLFCDQENLGALRNPRPALMMPCQVGGRTAAGDLVSLSELDLLFLVEAGVVAFEEDPIMLMSELVYRVTGGNNLPLDVTPTPNEPWRAGPDEGEQNPRDGLVSIVAITLGSEAWEDLNGNGRWDTGEPYTDLPEPLLDVDDDGVYTPGVDEFFDTNGDGEYSGPNDLYDARTRIWSSYKLLWTGPPDFSVSQVTTEPFDAVIVNGEQLRLQVLLLDQNLNPISGFVEREDHLVFMGSIPPQLIVQAEEMPFSNEIGMDFDALGRVERFWTDDQLSFSMWMRDADEQTVEASPIPWSISVTVHTTPGPLECMDGGICNVWADQETFAFPDPVEGTVQ